MKKLLILFLVLFLAGMASAYPEADFEDLTVGVISGQGGGSGWSGDWVDSSSFAVVQETGNKYMSHAGQATTKYMNRSVTSFTSNAYSFWHEVRFSTPIGSNIDEWGSVTCTEIQFRDASGNDPIHVKYEPSSKYLRVGNENMLDLGIIHDETIAGTWGGGSEENYWKNPVGNWCKVLLAVDADATDKSNAIAVYWELNDGSMGYVGDGTIQLGDETTVISNIKFGSKLGNDTIHVDFDNLEIVDGLVPEPATIMMLGLGGLALIRKRR